MLRAREVIGVLRGAQTVIEAGRKLQEDSLKTIWVNSSLKNIAKTCSKTEIKNVNELAYVANEIAARVNTVIAGLREFANYPPSRTTKDETTDFTPYSAPHPTPSLEQVSHLVNEKKGFEIEIKLTDSNKALLEKLDMEHQQKLAKMNAVTDQDKVQLTFDLDVGKDLEEKSKVKAVPNPKSKQSLSTSSKQRTVPSSRVGRLVSFGTLAAGLGLGTIAEYTRRTLGIGDSNQSSMAFLTEANMERIVDTLCKVRGAALKIGQILSIQDETILNPRLAKALERVRKSADFMPTWQLEKVLVLELGENWKDKFTEFEDRPFAAASIGQVHWAKTKAGKDVAIKIQYPGVAQGIESDMDNLFAVMKLWNIFPEGMFVDNLISVAKRELAWEVDYIREAECTRKFKNLLKPYPDYYVPEVIDDLSTKQVFTTEMLGGVPVDQCAEMDESHRAFIASKILELILRELLEFKYMQTDPNWANFLYNPITKKIMLLDFGASREYSEDFVAKYIKIIKATIDENRGQILTYSRDIGFLTGYETKVMEEVYVDAFMILGEMFKARGFYDFSKHKTTERMQKLIPTLITESLCPPPEEIYSFHRKLSGIFMLCAKLKAKIPARDIFFNLYSKYKQRQK